MSGVTLNPNSTSLDSVYDTFILIFAFSSTVIKHFTDKDIVSL